MKFIDKFAGTLKNLWIIKSLSNRYVFRILLALVVFLFLFLMLASKVVMERYDLKEGEISPVTIRAPKQVVNTIATQRLQKEAADRVPKVFKKDDMITENIINNINQAFDLILEIRGTDLTFNQKLELLQRDMPYDLVLESYNAALRISADVLEELRQQSIEIIKPVLEAGVRKEDIETEKNNIASRFQKLRYTMDVRTLGQDITLGALEPNYIPDVAATEKLQWEAMDKVKPVVIQKNAIIVEEGKEITSEHIAILKELDLLEVSHGENFLKMFGIALLVITMILVVTIYLYLFNNNTYRKRSHLLLLTIIFILSLLIANGVGVVSGYLMGITVTGGAMLISILLHSRLAILMNIMMAVLVGLLSRNDFIIAIIPMLSGIFGVFAVQKATQRSDLTRAAMILAVSNLVLINAFALIELRPYPQTILDSSMGILSGILASVYAIGFLPFLENTFGITTSLKLLELANPNQPLLKRLMLEAPGTYHHSIIVGNLAEAAANAIHADGLLARVGAYYHDIGKIKRPFFFIENQMYTDNPHDKCTPTLSTLIITSHVKDGLELAKEHKLPKVIQDIMVQHHGTGLLTYFYNKAAETADNISKEILESNYRYEGPKPQTKEAAIVMLADTIEAAVRSMKDPTPGKIEGYVRKLIKDKLNDDQLDECDITLKDLDEIAKAFCKVLTGIFHPRIEYPENALKELERGKQNGTGNSKQPDQGANNGKDKKDN